MTGSDLIVAAPWILFAIGLAVIYIRLLRARGRLADQPGPVRHAGRRHPRQRHRGDRDRPDDRRGAYFWQEILGFFAGLSRKLGDEAATLEKPEQPRRVA